PDVARSLLATGALTGGDAERAMRHVLLSGATHPGTARLTDALLSRRAIGGSADLPLGSGVLAAQVPHSTSGAPDWLADGPGTGDEPPRSAAIACLVSDGLLSELTAATSTYRGLWVDAWEDAVPNPTHTTGLAVHAPSPKSRAPQVLLLVPPPVVGEPWDVGKLEGAVLEALRLAKVRGVDLDALGGLAHILPAIYLPRSSDTSSELAPDDPFG
ncbi:MAG: hypothetical protein AAGI01_03015, partial [Myxococcota bacterium]